MDYAKHLIERIAAAPEHDRVGVLANELLREFHRGYPFDDLRQLLRSDDQEMVAIAVWIASELGEKCRPLLDQIVPLLAHPMKKIRFEALGCVFWSLPENGCDLAKALGLLDDPEPGVRWKTLDMLFRLSRTQIEAAYLCAKTGGLSSSHQNGLHWLLSDDALLPSSIESALQSSDPVVRKYAVVAAARLRKQHKEPLVYASTVDDEDVREFASGLL
ncbi:MAG TPA: hypothetical protein VG759_02000 [Candidatus Angelobacter sp.]|jgi:hypothetical protein|nr:hypothetical protein [Candidatus Angelobacter sp.]